MSEEIVIDRLAYDKMLDDVTRVADILRRSLPTLVREAGRDNDSLLMDVIHDVGQAVEYVEGAEGLLHTAFLSAVRERAEGLSDEERARYVESLRTEGSITETDAYLLTASKQGDE